MSPLAIRRTARRMRHHATGLLLVLALGGAIAAHHSAIGMGNMHHDGTTGAVEMCLGAFTAVGVAVAAVGIARLALGRWPTPVELSPSGALAFAAARAPEARAGPPPLSWLCLWRL